MHSSLPEEEILLLHTMICLISQVDSAPNISLVTVRRYTTVAVPPQECTPLTQVVVDPSRCTAIWTVSGRSSRGEWMVLSTSSATGPAMLMASVTLMVNTGWVWRTFTASLRGLNAPSSKCPSLILTVWRHLPLTDSSLSAMLPPSIASMLVAMQALQVIPWAHTMVQPSVHLTRTVIHLLAIVPSNTKAHGGIKPAIQATSTDSTSVDLMLAMLMELTGKHSKVITTPSSTLQWRSEQFEEQSIIIKNFNRL